MTILTVSEILSKMQRSHQQLLDLIVSDLRHARAPERALAPLLQLRSRAKLLGPSWFVNPTNYRAETNTALDAWEALFKQLESDESVWGAVSGTHEDDEVIADRMRRVATLAALTGHETAAVKLLQLAVERMPLQAALDVDGSARRWGDSTAGPEAVTRAFEAALHASAHHGALTTSPQQVRLPLEAALLLLLEGVEPPWLSVLVRLACKDRTPSLSASEPSVGERAFATLLEPLVQRHRFAPGASVLVWNSQGWRHAVVKGATAGGDSFDVLLRGFQLVKGIHERHVLAPAETGCGALLRAAASAGQLALVDLILRLGVSVFEADEHANSALHCAAAAGHVQVCSRLLEARADPEVPNQSMRKARRLAQEHGHMAVLRLFRPSASDLDVAAQDGKGTAHGATPTVPHRHRVTALMLASRSGKLPEVRSLLAASASMRGSEGLDAQSARGCTALLMAAEEGHAEVIRTLVEHGADVNLATEGGMTPLIAACENRHLDAVTALLRDRGAHHGAGSRASIEAHTTTGVSALTACCSHGDAEALKALISAGASVVLPSPVDGFTPLMAVAKGGHLALCKLLHEQRAAVDQKCDDGRTALMIACQQGHAEMARQLLSMAAAVDARTHAPPAPRTARHKAGSTSLMLAARYGHELVIRELVRHASLDLADKDGTTALMYATRNGHVGATQALLDAGADPNCMRVSGFTALMFAAKNGYKRTLVALLQGERPVEVDMQTLESEVEVDMQTRESKKDKARAGTSALMLAAQSGHASCVRELLYRKARVDLTDKDGTCALMYASRNGHVEAVKALLAVKETGVDQAKPTGMTSLMFAAKKGYLAVVSELLEHGANVNLVNHNTQHTALIEACENDHVSVAASLLRAGALASVGCDLGDAARATLAMARNGHQGSSMDIGRIHVRQGRSPRSSGNHPPRPKSVGSTDPLVRVGQSRVDPRRHNTPPHIIYI
jgi:ankyrin repeat protein